MPLGRLADTLSVHTELPDSSKVTAPETTLVTERIYEGGNLVGGRYELDRPIGSGGLGVVWSARDSVSGRSVAVKLLRRASMDHAFRQRREAAALRLLGIPGVVPLLDDGVDDGCPFLVMELIEGAPFPGAHFDGTWASMRDSAVSLLRTLDRVHATGLVHRDIKPANVLVRPGGSSLLLDFGLAKGPALRGQETKEGVVVGTPDFLSPEQLLGGAVDGRADLYAFGVMIFHCLAGRFPHAGADPAARMQGRVHRPATPLLDASPKCPATVAEWVDALLATRPSARPATAAEVVARILGEAVWTRASELPWLGSRRPVDSAVQRLRAGRPVRVGGHRGDGRARLLREVAAALQTGGTPVLTAVRAQRPLRSLLPLLTTHSDPGETPGDKRAAVLRLLHQHLDVGGVLVVADPPGLDHVSRDLVTQLAGRAVLSIAADGEPGDVAPEALGEGDLVSLFRGDDRYLRLRRDAAFELHRRTWGRPAAIADEIAAWKQQGVAAERDGGWFVDRHALDRLAADLEPARPVSTPDTALPDEVELREVLAWVDLAGSEADLSLLDVVVGRERWEIEASLAELDRRGLIQRAEARALVFRGGVATSEWTEDRRRDAHRRLAAALEGTPLVRLRHLLLADENVAAATLSLRIVGALLDEGRTGLALQIWQAGTLAARVAGIGVLRDQLEAGVRWSTIGEDLAWIEEVGQELRRASRLFDVARWSELVDARRAALRGTPTAELVPHAPEGTVEPLWLRFAVITARVRASWLRTPDVEEAELEAASLAAEQWFDDQQRASLTSWKGWQDFRRGRFREAAEHYALAARLRREGALRRRDLLNVAMAELEVGRADRVAELAHEVTRSSEPHGDLVAGVRAHSLAARARLRRCPPSAAPLADDPDTLVTAAETLGLHLVAANLQLHRAAVAWRERDRERTQPLAADAWRRMRGLNHRAGSALSGALASWCGENAAAQWLQDELRAGLEGLEWPFAIATAAAALDAGIDVPLSLRASLVSATDATLRPHGDVPRELFSEHAALARVAASMT